MLEIHPVPALSDNYVYLLREPESGLVAAVDPSEAGPVRAALKERGWRLTHILNTHHHWDHTGGNLDLKEETGATVVGPKADEERIPGIDVALGDGDTFAFGAETARIFHVPGHTRGAIAFYFPDSKALFSGDTLFSLGCGRLFEGTPRQMWDSLSKLRKLPPDTRLYCGHEYTAKNARFALTIEPENAALKERAAEVMDLRGKYKPTVPARMEIELKANPFLRADAPELRRALNMEAADPVDVFAEVRRRRDSF